MTIGEKVKQAREAKNMTQEELARALGYKSRTSINKIETGERDVPRRQIRKIAQILGVPAISLLGLDDDIQPYKMPADAPAINQVMPAFIEYVGDDNLLGHNLSFDLKFLYESGFDCFAKNRRYYDTLKIARSKLDDGLLENYKLTTLCDYYDIYRDDAHRSLSDCYATGKIYKKLLECYVLKSD